MLLLNILSAWFIGKNGLKSSGRIPFLSGELYVIVSAAEPYIL